MNIFRQLISNKLLNIAIKVLLFGLFIFLFNKLFLNKLDIDTIKSAISATEPIWLIVAFLMVVMRYLMLGLKFHIASRFFKVDIRLGKFISNEYKILFMEYIIPIPDAEDLFKIIFLKLKNIPIHKAFSIVLSTRIASLIVLLLLLIGIVYELSSLFISLQAKWLTIAFIALALMVISYKVWLGLLIHRIKKPNWLVTALKNIYTNNLSNKGYFTLIIISIFHYVFAALAIYFVLLSLGYLFSLINIILFLPFIILAFLIPLSLQGYGIPEAVLVFLLIKFNVPEEIAASAGILHLVIFTAQILIGSLLYFFDKDYSVRLFKEQIKQIVKRRKEEKII